MIRINENYLKLKASYLFSDIAKRVTAYTQANPDKPVIRLGIGDVTEPLTPSVLKAFHAGVDEMAVRATFKGYGPEQGYAFLREAIATHDYAARGCPVAADEIFVSDGSKCDCGNIQEIFATEGLKLAIPDPVYPVYVDTNVMAGRTGANLDGRYAGITYLDSTPANGYVPAIPAAATDLIYLCFPNNPTGAVCSRAEMREIADVLLAHPHVFVMADDVYEHLTYDGFGFCTVAEVEPKLKERTLTVNGASKAYAMTGWRVGFAGGPRPMIAAMTNMQGQIGSGISTISQAAAVAALNGPQDLLKERAADYQKRRDEVVGMLRQAKGLTCHKPEGAFYVFPNMAGCIGKTTPGGRKIANDTDFVTALLEEKHVATVQGAAYGMSPYFRISYATDMASLREGCKRIQEFCGELR